MSLIRNFNIKVTTEPYKLKGYSVWFTTMSNADKIFVR